MTTASLNAYNQKLQAAHLEAPTEINQVELATELSKILIVS